MQVDLLSAGGGAVLQEGAGPGGGASEVACLSAARSAAPDLGGGHGHAARRGAGQARSRRGFGGASERGGRECEMERR